MIVVAIIGLLAAVAIPNLVKAKKNAQVNGCKANLRTIEFAIAQWSLEKRKADDVEVSLEELEEYFKDGIPRCPSGGDYERLSPVTFTHIIRRKTFWSFPQ